MLRRCPFCHAPIGFKAIITYRLALSAELPCARCKSDIAYVFSPGLTWPATGFAMGLLASKVALSQTGSVAMSLLVFVAIVAGVAVMMYYTTPLKSG
jgi:hypothetical protein